MDILITALISLMIGAIIGWFTCCLCIVAGNEERDFDV